MIDQAELCQYPGSLKYIINFIINSKAHVTSCTDWGRTTQSLTNYSQQRKTYTVTRQQNEERCPTTLTRSGGGGPLAAPHYAIIINYTVHFN